MSYFLGLEIKQGDEEIFVSQKGICKRNFEKIQDGGLQAG
jgi:hypothetical protein